MKKHLSHQSESPARTALAAVGGSKTLRILATLWAVTVSIAIPNSAKASCSPYFVVESVPWTNTTDTLRNWLVSNCQTGPSFSSLVAASTLNWASNSIQSTYDDYDWKCSSGGTTYVYTYSNCTWSPSPPPATGSHIPSCTMTAASNPINPGDTVRLTCSLTSGVVVNNLTWNDGTVTAFSDTTGASYRDVSPTTTTTYSGTPSNTYYTGSASSVTVTVNPATPVCTLTALPATINLGDTSTLTASCSPAATSYTWTGSGFGSSASGGNVSPTATATYSVVGHNASGDSTSASTTVTVNALTDVTSITQVNASALALNRATGKYNGTITVTNTGVAAFTGPVYVFFTLPSGVTLPSLATVGGVPYLAIPGGLAAGATTSSVSISFTDPSNARIGYTTKRYVVSAN